jgi:hypothetical protein
MFYMVILKDGIVLHEREYYSACMCVEKMATAYNYYNALN